MGKHKKKGKKNEEAEEGSGGIFGLGISQETSNSISGVFCFLVAVVSVLAFVGKAGSAGIYFDAIARSLFGYGFFIVPVAFAMLGVAFIKSIHRKVALSALLGTLLFVLSVLGVFYSLGEGATTDRIVQGGYLGVGLGWPLLSFLGFWATMVILAGLVVVSVLLTLDVPIYQLFMRSSPEEDEAHEEVMKEKDIQKLVVKSGGKMLDDKAVAATSAPAPKKEETKQSEFVVRALKSGNWRTPPTEFLSEDQDHASSGDINASAAIIKRTLANFGIEVEMGEVSVGPTVTQFTMRPAVGVKLSRITTLSSDLSLALAAHPIRIEAPIPGNRSWVSKCRTRKCRSWVCALCSRTTSSASRSLCCPWRWAAMLPESRCLRRWIRCRTCSSPDRPVRGSRLRFTTSFFQCSTSTARSYCVSSW
jgi:S-DNA-T family DNA segregation ATPase FtsK/SpoIIIE